MKNLRKRKGAEMTLPHLGNVLLAVPVVILIIFISAKLSGIGKEDSGTSKKFNELADKINSASLNLATHEKVSFYLSRGYALVAFNKDKRETVYKCGSTVSMPTPDVPACASSSCLCICSTKDRCSRPYECKKLDFVDNIYFDPFPKSKINAGAVDKNMLSMEYVYIVSGCGFKIASSINPVIEIQKTSDKGVVTAYLREAK
jgi:hypothetical protein